MHELPGKIAISFIFVTNDGWLTDIGNLQTDYAVAIETYKLDLVRGLPVYPFLERRLAVHFAHFLIGLAHGLQHHLTVHADQNFVVQDRTLKFWREGVGKGLDRSLERKVDHGRDQLAHLGSSHLRNKLVKTNCIRAPMGTWPSS